MISTAEYVDRLNRSLAEITEQAGYIRTTAAGRSDIQAARNLVTTAVRVVEILVVLREREDAALAARLETSEREIDRALDRLHPAGPSGGC